MKRRTRSVATFVLATLTAGLAVRLSTAQQATTPQPGAKKAPAPVSVTAKPDELAKIKDKTEQIEALVKECKAKHADPVLLGDVEVYAKAGRMLGEIPDMFGSQAAIEHAFKVLDQGIERARQLQNNEPQWNQ